MEGTFTVTIEDIFEDLDDDGTADHLDEDMDGDGFSNDEEKAIGSNPISAEPLSLNDANFFDAIKLWFAAEATPPHFTGISVIGMYPGLPR